MPPRKRRAATPPAEEALPPEPVEEVEVVAPEPEPEPELVQEAEPVPVVASTPVYVARRPLRMGGKNYHAGDVLPGAETWTRVQTWVNAGYIKLKED